MATLESIKVYYNGTELGSTAGEYLYIGVYNNAQHERVLGFRTGATGATDIAVSLTYSNSGTNKSALRAIITGSDACVATGRNPVVEGATECTVSGGKVNFSIEDGLLPNTMYYLHVFADGASNASYVTVNGAISGGNVRVTIDLDGTYGGLLRVWDTNGAEHRCIPYVYDGTQWKQCLAFVDDGTAWHMGV